jgi:hypothetical protein
MPPHLQRSPVTIFPQRLQKPMRRISTSGSEKRLNAITCTLSPFHNIHTLRSLSARAMPQTPPRKRRSDIVQSPYFSPKKGLTTDDLHERLIQLKPCLIQGMVLGLSTNQSNPYQKPSRTTRGNSWSQ